MEEAFIQEGHSLIFAKFTANELQYGDVSNIDDALTALVSKTKPEIVFTVDYFPSVTNFCSKQKLRYISWIYDSPYDWMYFTSILDPCNVVYMLDKEICLEFQRAGISHVHYLPMAANIERLDTITIDLPLIYKIAFVGALYLENDTFSKGADILTSYAKGYVDALVATQLKISGYNFISELLDPILGELCRVYQRLPLEGDMRTDNFFCTESIINPWISGVERIDLLEAVAQRYSLDLFTHYKDLHMPNLHNHGTVNYYREMPRVFKQSKINLNISRRGMKSAVPLRCFDIMGAGGFLLSNFQAGFLDLFVPGEDFIYYENKEDMLQKIGYYLKHDKERNEIAKNGHDKIASKHTYRHRVREMLDSLK